MKELSQNGSNVLLQNSHAKLIISAQDASVQQVIDLKTGKDIRGEETPFFALVNQDKEVVAPTGVCLQDNVLNITTELGDFSVQVDIDEDYFVFTLLTHLPEGAFQGLLANANYAYDYKDKANTGACGIAMTYWANPVYYPDSKDCATRCEITRHLQDINGKYALIIAPIDQQRDIIKKVSLTIDRNVGIMSEIGGAWGRDSRLNFGNYMLEWETEKAYFEATLPFYKSIGVDQIDYHQSANLNFRQGDFKFERYANAAEFKKNVVDRLTENGIQAGLHTYAFYIRYDCDAILSDPVWQKDLSILETFTLAQDITAEDMFLPTVESTKDVSVDDGFFAKNTLYILVGEEIMQYESTADGFHIAKRGWAGTKATPHKAGETIKHIDGYYGVIAPIPGSELFLQIARNTAKAYNDAGFRMIYLDALDGIRMHCGPNESWYYAAMFLCEILKYCEITPLIEYSTIFPSIWPGRGRVGAYDTANRGYKRFIDRHVEDNARYIDRYSAPTLGWYDFFPKIENFPGNEHTKYHHTDDTEYLGSKALMYDFSIVHAGTAPKWLDRYAGLRRNVAIYRKYDDLRKAAYFDQERLEKLKEGKWEYRLKEKEDGEYTFEERDYQKVKLYDLNDADRNCGKFNNPFGQQLPFIRIEAMYSTAGGNAMELMHFDEDKELLEQELCAKYAEGVNLNGHLAKKVRVCGNGKAGGAVVIRNGGNVTGSGRGYLQYVIDTDFEGWREFILMETDNGERYDLPFEMDQHIYANHRSTMTKRLFGHTEVLTTGDMTGVRMGNVYACEHVYEILKNPTVKIGDTEIMFECELMSSDYIEFDGKTAKVIDRYGNEKTIWYQSNLQAPSGEFTAELTAKALNGNVARAKLTLGFTGEEV